ncbi:MAG: AAA family ATPase [Myxococcota bacterium]
MRLSVLGRFEVRLDDGPLPAATWRRKRAVDLLTALAVAEGHAVPKADLISGFWPGKDPSRGANNLHRALHDVRKALGGGPWVSIDGPQVRLAEDVWVDVAAFEAGCHADDPEALDLYRGTPGLDLDMLDARIEALRQHFIDSSLRCARRALASHPDRATAVLRHLLAIETAIEEAHRLLMRGLADTGRIAEAMDQYTTCEQALAERGVSPSGATVALAESLASRSRSTPTPQESGWPRLSRILLGTRDPAPLLGRQAELDEVREFSQAQGGVLLITGTAGIGKTRLAVEAARFAEADGAVLLAGAGLDFEGMPPFAPFIEAFTAWDRMSGSGDNPFLAFEPSGAVQDDTLRLYQAVEQALNAIGAGRRVCLVLDDLHQADGSSLHLLHYLARTTRTSGVVLIATARPEGLIVGAPLHSVVAALHRERLLTRIDLLPFDQATTSHFIAQLVNDAPTTPIVARIHDLAEGNPFYVEELVHAWSETGKIALPGELRDAVLDRIHRLGDDANALMRAAAVVGQHFEFDLAADVASLRSESALDALERCLDADLLREDDDRYRFRHALVQEAVHSSITSARLRLVHREVARNIEERWPRLSDRVERLARHHRLANDVDRAIPYLIEAAQRARQQTGLREVVAFYNEALELLGDQPADSQMFEILLGLGQAQLLLSQLEAAVASLDRAAELRSAGWAPSPANRGRALRLGGLALITSGHLEPAEVRIQAALEALEASDDDAQLTDTLYYLAQLRWHQNRHDEAYAVAESCLAAAERTRDPKSIARGYEMLALACHSLGSWHEGERYEAQREALVGGPVDVAQSFDVHL